MDFSFSGNLLICFIFFFFFIVLLSISLSVKVIPENKRISVQRLGRHLGYRGPGIVMLMPFIDRGEIINATDLLAHEKQFSGLMEAKGTAVGLIDHTGTVVIEGREYRASSETLIPDGAMVRVKGIRLEVERIL